MIILLNSDYYVAFKYLKYSYKINHNIINIGTNYINFFYVFGAFVINRV